MNNDEVATLEDDFDLKFAGAHLAMMDQYLEVDFPEMDVSKMSYQEKNEFILDSDKPIQIARFAASVIEYVALQRMEIERLEAKLAGLNN